MVTIADLRCENERVPLAVAATRPRFSWKLAGGERGTAQAKRRIQVAEDPLFLAPTWDTGDIADSESHLVPYAGPPLAARTRYYYRVRAETAKGESSPWCDPSWFETGIGRWGAPFVGRPDLSGPAESRPLYVRRAFEIVGTVRSARLYATACGVYEAWLNGRRIGDSFLAPGWTNYRSRLQYQCYDVTDYLRNGENAIGLIVGAGWYCGELTWHKVRGLYGNHPNVSAELVVETEEGARVALQTDTSWRIGTGPITYSELYHGETFDARLADDRWSTGDFDDSGYAPAVVTDTPACDIIPQEGAWVREHGRFQVAELLTTPKGETVLDFGQNLSGWVQFTVRGKAGDRVVLRHAEVLDRDGNFYTENLRSARQRIEYVVGGSLSERYAPHFTFQGFRYVLVEEFPGPVDPAAFAAVVLQSDMTTRLEFECSNELLNRLHHNILWGWRGNSVDVPTDCPQRDERLGWTGDAQVFIGTALYLTDGEAFFRKWLRDLASEQREDGGVPFVIPDVLSGIKTADTNLRGSHSSTGWGDAAVICPWTFFERYGDRDLLRELYPVMKRWVDYIREQADDGLLWKSGFHFGDWVALDAKEGSYFGATPNDLTATAYYAYSAGMLARAAEALGERDDALYYRALREDIVEAFQREFVTPAGRIAARTQTAHVLALAFGLLPQEHRERAVRDLVALIDESGGHLTTGFLGTPAICRVLADNGRLDRAYALLLRDDFPSWLYQVRKGATTVWEHWDGIKPDGSMWSPQMNSFNHYAYGAVGQWMYETIGGLRPSDDGPGFRRFVLAPRPGGGITYARLQYESPYGIIRVAWRLDEAGLAVSVTVPANSTASLKLEGVRPETVTGDAEIAFHDESGAATAVLPSGEYEFRARSFG